MTYFERLAKDHITSALPDTLDPLQFAYHPNRSIENAITIALHAALSHLDKWNTYVRMLFIDYSSAFNTIVASKLIIKLEALGLNPVQLGPGLPDGPSPVEVEDLITNNNETAYREEVGALGVWCQENNFSLNVNKIKEMIVDFRKQQREHPPIHINRAAVEKVESFKFLGIHITDKLKWSTHTDSVVKKAQQHLFNRRRLNTFGMSPKTLTNFYRCTNKSLLSGCITAWYGNCTAHNRKALQRVVRSTQRITRGKLPAFQDIYITRCHRKAKNIIKDNNHPCHCLFTLLGHQTVKQPPLAQRGCCLLTDLKSLATLTNGSLVTLLMPL